MVVRQKSLHSCRDDFDGATFVGPGCFPQSPCKALLWGAGSPIKAFPNNLCGSKKLTHPTTFSPKFPSKIQVFRLYFLELRRLRQTHFCALRLPWSSNVDSFTMHQHEVQRLATWETIQLSKYVCTPGSWIGSDSDFCVLQLQGTRKQTASTSQPYHIKTMTTPRPPTKTTTTPPRLPTKTTTTKKTRLRPARDV